MRTVPRPTGRALVLAAAVTVTAAAAAVTVTVAPAEMTAHPQPAATDQQVGASKQQMIADMDAEQQRMDADRAAHPAPRQHPFAAAPSSPATLPPPAHHGQVGSEQLYAGVPLPFPPSVLTVTNLYLDLRGHTYLGLYAGATPGQPQQGAIVVSADDAVGGNPAYRPGTFLAPQPDGPLTLTQVHGDQVTYRTRHHTGTFDLATHRYTTTS